MSEEPLSDEELAVQLRAAVHHLQQARPLERRADRDAALARAEYMVGGVLRDIEQQNDIEEGDA